jgi:hypothetical protein
LCPPTLPEEVSHQVLDPHRGDVIAEEEAVGWCRYDRASTILTSNEGFEEWGEIFSDEMLAAALMNREYCPPPCISDHPGGARTVFVQSLW